MAVHLVEEVDIIINNSRDAEHCEIFKLMSCKFFVYNYGVQKITAAMHQEITLFHRVRCEIMLKPVELLHKRILVLG